VRNSSGAVVPVLSDNVHEARGYNRLAQLAKAPLIMLWQDDQVRGLCAQGLCCGAVPTGCAVGLLWCSALAGAAPWCRKGARQAWSRGAALPVCRAGPRAAGQLAPRPGTLTCAPCCSVPALQIPQGCGWLQEIQYLFQRFPEMGACGHNGCAGCGPRRSRGLHAR
jgi:hypothetical protein